MFSRNMYTKIKHVWYNVPMTVAVSKTFLEQKLQETSALSENASPEQKAALQEQAYWLTQALENENPNDMLERAFSFWKRTNGKTGLQPFKIIPDEPQPASAPPPAMLTVWGMLDRAFQNGEHLDDRHVSDIFNRLPAAAQTHFIDTVANHIRMETSVIAPDITPTLKNEALLLSLVEKTKLTTTNKEENIQQVAKKLTDWQRYHQNEPQTEEKLEETLFGAEAAKVYIRNKTDENQKLRQHVLDGGMLTVKQEESIMRIFPAYELFIRDRLRMTTAEYLRMRHVPVEKLLSAVPTDPQKIELVLQSAVRQDLLAVPDAEFHKRVRTAALVRSYSFHRELYPVTIRQFFRSVVEK